MSDDKKRQEQADRERRIKEAKAQAKKVNDYHKNNSPNA